MNDSILLLALGIVGVVLVFGILKLRARASKPHDFSDEKSILAEVEIYEAYGRSFQAVALLKEAIEANSECGAYKRKLRELQQGGA